MSLPPGTKVRVVIQSKDLEAAIERAQRAAVLAIGEEIAKRIRERIPQTPARSDLATRQEHQHTRDTVKVELVNKSTVAISAEGAIRFLEFGTSERGAQTFRPPPTGEASGKPYRIPRQEELNVRAIRQPAAFSVKSKPRMQTVGYKVVHTERGPRRVPINKRIGGNEYTITPAKQQNRAPTGQFLPSTERIRESYVETGRRKKMLRWVDKDGKVHFARSIPHHTGMAAKMPMSTSIYEVLDDPQLVMDIVNTALSRELSKEPLRAERVE